jgi:hypothetical protein
MSTTTGVECANRRLRGLTETPEGPNHGALTGSSSVGSRCWCVRPQCPCSWRSHTCQRTRTERSTAPLRTSDPGTATEVTVIKLLARSLYWHGMGNHGSHQGKGTERLLSLLICNGYWGPCTRGQSGLKIKLTTEPRLVPRSKNAWSLSSTSPCTAWCLCTDTKTLIYVTLCVILSKYNSSTKN